MDGARATALRRVERFTGRSLAGLLAVAGLGAGFGLLLMLVRFGWGPLYHVDHGAAESLNRVVSGQRWLVNALQGVSFVGGPPVTVWLVVIVAVAVLIRRQPRLAAYVAVTGLGASILDPSLKLIVGRLRPVVDVPVASAPGNSFPSGHALGSTVAYGAVLLVFLPVVPRRLRPVAIAAYATLVALVGFSRIALGVHYISDVLAGWLLGLAWLGVTAYAFRMWRREAGQPAPPLLEGIEPEAAGEIAPAPAERHMLPNPRAGVAELITGWVLIFGVLLGLGQLVSHHLGGTPIGRFDTGVPRWFAELRTPALDRISWWLSQIGNTAAITAVALVFCPLAVALLRQLRPALFVALALIGQATIFVSTAKVTGRQRPDVPHLDGSLPTSSFPSGHIAATICLYVTIAIVVMTRTGRWWRWLALAAAVVLPCLVMVARLYRGMHHPTDVFGSVLLAALWIILLWWVVRPAGGRVAGDDGLPAAGRPPAWSIGTASVAS